MLKFNVICEWKGSKTAFEVVADNKDLATDIAAARCKKESRMPKSAIQTVAFAGRADGLPYVSPSVR